MRKAVLSLTELKASKRMMLALFAACLVGMVALYLGVGIRTAETQTTAPKMQDLGTLGGSSSYASGINGSGKVIGSSSTSDGSSHGFLYDGTMQDLGTLPGGSGSYTSGINDSGKVIGSSSTSDGSSHGFLYDSDIKQMHDLNDLIPADSGWTITSASAIDSDGKIAASGYGNNPPDWSVCPGSETGPAYGDAFVLTPATTDSPATYDVQDLGHLGGYYSRATGMNDSGQVVGYSYTDPCVWSEAAFLYDSTKGMQLLSMSEAMGLNDTGKVVGYVEEFINWTCVNVGSGYDCWRAVLYDSATKQMQYLGDLRGTYPSGWRGVFGSVANGINDDGDVVGRSGIQDGTYGGDVHAFLKESGQPMVDLNTLLPADPGWTIYDAKAINGDDKIAANGTKDGGESHALLLTPPYVTIPAAPTELTAKLSGSQTNQSIALSWKDNSNDETSFTVERSPDGKNWSTLTSTLWKNTTSYTDYNVSRRSSYYYQVKATNSAGSSAPSNVAGPVKTK